jgi:hypothetical protein
MLLKYIEYAAACICAAFALITLVVASRYRREIWAAERRKAKAKLHVVDASKFCGSEIGMKETEADKELVGVK